MKRLLDILFAWRELEALRPLGVRGWALVMAVFVLATLSLGAEQFATPKLVGADGYFHTRMATVMAEEGLGQGFRWTQASVWKDRFADKEFLFHVLLMPFVALDDVIAPKVLTVLLMALLASLLAAMAWRHAWPWPWLWPSMLAGAGVLFHLRVSMTRPHLLSILLVVMAAQALLRKHRPLLLGLAILFPLVYTAAHMLLALCLVYGVARLVMRQGFPWREFALVLGGTAIGLLLHPHRDHLIYLWHLVNIQVVTNAFDRLGALAVEFLPPDGRLLLVDVGPLFLGVFGVGLAFSLLGKKSQSGDRFFLSCQCSLPLSLSEHSTFRRVLGALFHPVHGGGSQGFVAGFRCESLAEETSGMGGAGHHGFHRGAFGLHFADKPGDPGHSLKR